MRCGRSRRRRIPSLRRAARQRNIVGASARSGQSRLERIGTMMGLSDRRSLNGTAPRNALHVEEEHPPPTNKAPSTSPVGQLWDVMTERVKRRKVRAEA